MRYFAAFIVLFWALMLGLLVRLQLYPDGTDVLAIPPEHVLGLLFVHAQPSDLSIRTSAGTRIGSIALRPSHPDGDGNRELGFSGNVHIQFPPTTKQRILWETQIRLDPKLSPIGAQIQLSTREPEYQLSVTLDPKEHTADYTLATDGKPVDSATVALTEDGLSDLLRRLNFDPSGLKALRTGTATPEIRAKRTKFPVRGNEIEAFRISVHQGDQLLAEAYVSQLGQVLVLKTTLGFQLIQDDLFP